VKFLLDTQLLLWAASASRKLPRKVRPLLGDTDNTLYFSAVSLWEITIKLSLGRADFTVSAGLLRRGLLDNDWLEFPVTGLHALALEKLPPLHKDPFDRLLLAQADAEGFTLITADKMLGQYPGNVKVF
jgi:PIN domain nuclease of toxin-antitoxin system